jgi:hypothetical protein
MKPRKAMQTKKAKIQSRNAVFRTWVLSSLTRFAGYRDLAFCEVSK